MLLSQLRPIFNLQPVFFACSALHARPTTTSTFASSSLRASSFERVPSIGEVTATVNGHLSEIATRETSNPTLPTLLRGGCSLQLLVLSVHGEIFS